MRCSLLCPVCVRAAAPVSAYMSLMFVPIKAVNVLAVHTAHARTLMDDKIYMTQTHGSKGIKLAMRLT